MNRIPRTKAAAAARAKPLKTATQTRYGRPRPDRAARLRQSADLPRLDRALSEREDFLARKARYTYGPRERRPPKALEDALERAQRARRDGAGAVRARGDFDRAAGVPQGRRPPAGHRRGLSPDAKFLRHDPQALRRRDDLLRPADRRRTSRSCSSRTPARCSPRRRARCRSRCRTSRRSPRSRMRATRSC